MEKSCKISKESVILRPWKNRERLLSLKMTNCGILEKKNFSENCLEFSANITKT